MLSSFREIATNYPSLDIKVFDQEDSSIRVTLKMFPGIEIVKKEFDGELPAKCDILLPTTSPSYFAAI